MPVKRRTNKRRDAISEDEAAWLRGDRNCGFIQFTRDEELQELWEYGDHDAFYWEPPMSFPKKKPIGPQSSKGKPSIPPQR